MSESKKVVLAYSGGLDSSIIIPWLKERGWEVHCLAGDVGQGAEELVGLEEKAAATGATTLRAPQSTALRTNGHPAGGLDGVAGQALLEDL